MGKKSKERAAKRRDPQLEEQHAWRQLNRINKLVNQAFGTQALCVEAAALFARAAADLGHDVEARAVALLAQYDDNTVALGAAAMAAFEDGLAGFAEVEDDLTGTTWDGAGHVVVVHRATGWMFDPTLPQVSARLGYRMPAFTTRLDVADLDTGPWDFRSDDGLLMRYYLVPDDSSWVEGFEAARRHCRETADDVANLVRSNREGVLVFDDA